MVRYPFLCFPVILASGGSVADETSLVGLVAKPVALEIMQEVGLHCLADLGADYSVEGDGQAVEKLAAARAKFSRVTTLHLGDDIYLLTPQRLGAEVAYSGALLEIGDGLSLTTIAQHEADHSKGR